MSGPKCLTCGLKEDALWSARPSSPTVAARHCEYPEHVEAYGCHPFVPAPVEEAAGPRCADDRCIDEARGNPRHITHIGWLAWHHTPCEPCPETEITCGLAETHTHHPFAPSAPTPPKAGESRECLLCSRVKPWGTFSTTTGAVVCKDCRDAAEHARLQPSDGEGEARDLDAGREARLPRDRPDIIAAWERHLTTELAVKDAEHTTHCNLKDFAIGYESAEAIRADVEARLLACAGCGEMVAEAVSGGHVIAGSPPDLCGPVFPTREAVAHLLEKSREDLEQLIAAENQRDALAEALRGVVARQLLGTLYCRACERRLADCAAGTFAEECWVRPSRDALAALDAEASQ